MGEALILGFDVPAVVDHQILLKLVNFSLEIPDINTSRQILTSQLVGCLESLRVCRSMSKSLPTQTVILYGEFVENAYKPDSLVQVSSILESRLNGYSDLLDLPEHKRLYEEIF